ncbi:MAG: hypothetical protein CVU39_08160 [Chloroflexi bacterium HGW-Chloroflexi-10]|nr:MAG: hypothetical protein CVU39_08160 [Chloroflexi bacterium HGW-Chloroflexi-10]
MDNELLKDQTQLNSIGSLVFRGLHSEQDYPLIHEIFHSHCQADNHPEKFTLEDIARSYAPTAEFIPDQQVLIAFHADQPAEAVGYSRLGWYSSSADTRLYYQISRLKQEYRGQGFWQEIVRRNEQQLLTISAGHGLVTNRFYQAWAPDYEVDWMVILETSGYQVVRRFNNMLRQLGDVPDYPMPAGFEIRPVRPEHMRRIWEAQKEMNDGLFENVEGDWLEEKYPEWLEDSSHTPQFWQVAWDGEELVGMVHMRIDYEKNKEHNQKRGLTEHIYVRPGWRKRGLASALIVRGLQVLKEQGMQEAELGVDAENESSAYALYEHLGYKTFYVDTWYRKPMP